MRTTTIVTVGSGITAEPKRSGWTKTASSNKASRVGRQTCATATEFRERSCLARRVSSSYGRCGHHSRRRPGVRPERVSPPSFTDLGEPCRRRFRFPIYGWPAPSRGLFLAHGREQISDLAIQYAYKRQPHRHGKLLQSL